MIGLIVWLIIGGVVGWLAGMIMRDNQGVVMNIVVGIVGSFLGGLIFSLDGEINDAPLTVESFPGVARSGRLSCWRLSTWSAGAGSSLIDCFRGTPRHS